MLTLYEKIYRLSMKAVIIICVLSAGIYLSANGQVTTTAVSAVDMVSADSVQMFPGISKADELFLFKNNDGISADKGLTGYLPTKCCITDFCPFTSAPECCPMSVVCRKIKTSVMLAQIK